MTDTSSVSARARIVYDQIKAHLEASHLHAFVAVEPDSGQYFLGTTLSEAVGSARTAFPDRITHTFRVGHQAAIHFGAHLS